MLRFLLPGKMNANKVQANVKWVRTAQVSTITAGQKYPVEILRMSKRIPGALETNEHLFWSLIGSCLIRRRVLPDADQGGFYGLF